MGIIRNNLALVVGTVCGIYIGQNYNVPNVKKVVTEAIDKFKQKEKEIRKPDADA